MSLGIAIPIASDLVGLILKYDGVPNLSISEYRLGRDIIGLVNEKNLQRKGSSESAKRRGDSGQPCLVPLVIPKEGDNTQFTFT